MGFQTKLVLYKTKVEQKYITIEQNNKNHKNHHNHNNNNNFSSNRHNDRNAGPAIMMMPPHIRATFMPNPPIAYVQPPNINNKINKNENVDLIPLDDNNNNNNNKKRKLNNVIV